MACRGRSCSRTSTRRIVGRGGARRLRCRRRRRRSERGPSASGPTRRLASWKRSYRIGPPRVRRRSPPCPLTTSVAKTRRPRPRRPTVTLNRERTDALLHAVPEVYRTRVDEVLLAAIAEGLGAALGATALRVDLEGHGREPLSEDVDLTRTVGWFTTIYPVVLPVKRDPCAALRAVKNALRAVPHRGSPPSPGSPSAAVPPEPCQPPTRGRRALRETL